MKRVCDKGIKLLLICVILSPAVVLGNEPVRDALFYVERNKNANIVQYDAQVGPDGLLYAGKPVVAYWVRLAEQGQVRKLTWLQKTFAYGFRAKLDKEENTVELQMTAKLGRSIEVRKVGDDYRAVTRINGIPSYIDKVFVNATRKGLLTRVNYIELFGNDVTNNEKQYERFSP